MQIDPIKPALQAPGTKRSKLEFDEQRSKFALTFKLRRYSKTVSRSLVLVVSMGYGVVRPTLGGLTRKVVSLSAAYFVATSTLDVMTNVGTIDDLTSSARIFLVGHCRLTPSNTRSKRLEPCA